MLLEITISLSLIHPPKIDCSLRPCPLMWHVIVMHAMDTWSFLALDVKILTDTIPTGWESFDSQQHCKSFKKIFGALKYNLDTNHTGPVSSYWYQSVSFVNHIIIMWWSFSTCFSGLQMFDSSSSFLLCLFQSCCISFCFSVQKEDRTRHLLWTNRVSCFSFCQSELRLWITTGKKSHSLKLNAITGNPIS
jgi:hypothetical protein